MGRRGENIHKRRDMRWEARVIIGPPINGRTNYKSLYARTYAEVRAKKLKFLAELNAPPSSTAAVLNEPEGESLAFSFLDSVLPLSLPPESFDMVLCESQDSSFGDIAVQWLSSKKPVLKESSLAFYTFIVEKHLFPKFEKIDVKNVDSDMIAAFLADEKHHGRIKDSGPLSDKTLSEIKSILYRILRYARSHSYIDEVPESVPLRVKKEPIEVLTKTEQKRLESQAMKEDTLFTLGVLLCLYTGIREGELCALQWADFDWENGTITINKTVSRVSDLDGVSGAKTHIVIDTPKTESSIRIVPIPENILPYFRERVGDSANYVTTGKEKCMEPRVCRDRFKRLQTRAGIDYHNFHILRHTYATNCIAQGMDVNTLKANLGHSDISTTLQLYVHPSMESRKEQVNKLKTFAD